MIVEGVEEFPAALLPIAADEAEDPFPVAPDADPDEPEVVAPAAADAVLDELEAAP